MWGASCDDILIQEAIENAHNKYNATLRRRMYVTSWMLVTRCRVLVPFTAISIDARAHNESVSEARRLRKIIVAGIHE